MLQPSLSEISYCYNSIGYFRGMIEITCNDRCGKKVRVKCKYAIVNCSPDDTIGDLKKLIAAQTGTAPEKIILKKWYLVHHFRYNIYKDHITLQDCIKLITILDEITDGMNLELYYQ